MSTYTELPGLYKYPSLIKALSSTAITTDEGLLWQPNAGSAILWELGYGNAIVWDTDAIKNAFTWKSGGIELIFWSASGLNPLLWSA
jgi:hypothetical protein